MTTSIVEWSAWAVGQRQDRCSGCPVRTIGHPHPVGASPDAKDTQTGNLVTISEVIKTFHATAHGLKIRTSTDASEWFNFKGVDKIYFLKHGPHCYVLLYIAKENKAFIADGSNTFRTDQKIANEIKARLGVRLISVPFNQQLKIDHCGSSAVAIAVGLIKLHREGVKYKELTCPKSVQNRLVKRMHKKKSKALDKELHETRLICEICGKTYRQTEGRKMWAHRWKEHKISTQ